VAVRQAQLERAARLWAAAQAINDTRGLGRALGDHPDKEHHAAAIPTQLDEAIFAAAWAAGRAMTLEQAIAYALEEGQVDAVSSTAATTARQ
jgi:hypothetical protein